MAIGHSKIAPLEVLQKRAEFLSVAAARQKSVAQGVIVQVRFPSPAEEDKPIRLGLTASKKVGNAVARNRARRRLRALARDVLPAFATGGLDIVLIARTETVDRPFADLRADLLFCLKRLRVLRIVPEDPS